MINMTQWALIQDGRVSELTDLDPEGRYHPDLEWVDAPDGVAIGYTYENGKFYEPVVEPALCWIFSPREYIRRFSMEEQVAIRKAQFSDMEVGLVYDEFNRAQFIDLNDPAVAAGIDLYISKGLLAPERREPLLNPGTVSAL